jgi:hypothetical protein
VTHRNPSTHRGAREQRPPHSQETRERLRVLWASGLSSQEIGRRLDMSKNGVVGLAHRMGLPQRPSPIRPANPATPPLPRASRRVAADVVRLASPSAVSGSTARAPVLPARAAANPPPVLAATSPPSQPVTPDRPAAAAPLGSPRGCQWPLWGKLRSPDDIRFCEAPVRAPGESWCTACRDKVFTKRVPAELRDVLRCA